LELASVVATTKIAWVEARSAFARARREGLVTAPDHRQLSERPRHDWMKFMVVEVSGELIEFAGQLVEEFFLRGSDAIHLASALLLKHQTGQELMAACWDVRLWDALKQAGLETLPKHRPNP
jgi:hypothetical protein